MNMTHVGTRKSHILVNLAIFYAPLARNTLMRYLKTAILATTVDKLWMEIVSVYTQVIIEFSMTIHDAAKTLLRFSMQSCHQIF